MFRIQLNEMRSGVPTYFMLNVNAVAVCIFVVVAVVDIIKRILKQTQKLIHIHKWAVGGGASEEDRYCSQWLHKKTSAYNNLWQKFDEFNFRNAQRGVDFSINV